MTSGGVRSGSRADVAGTLRRILPADRVVDDVDVLGSYRRDHAGLVSDGMPSAAVFPRSTHEVQDIMRFASATPVPVVCRGAGSGLAGGANAIDDAIILCLAHMNRILRLAPEDQLAVVQPGVLNVEVAKAASDHGLTYPPDPASRDFSTIGGNIATNAGGLCCVKYGVTREYVLGLEVVLASGEVLRTGRQTVKGVAGYDLVGLFVGSEGTLGVITEATLRLRPPGDAPITMAAFFPSLEGAGKAVAAATAAGILPSLFEVMDQATIAAVEQMARMALDVDAAALLIAQSDAGPGRALDEITALVACCNDAGASMVVHSDDPADSDQLLAARRLAFTALERQGRVLLDDVAVPRSRIPELLRATSDIAAGEDIRIGTFGHVGDGNMHPTLIYEDGEEAKAERAFRRIVEAALDLGGTVTGEHGIGLLKRDLLERELGPVGVRVHRAIKRALDPEGILNPGKLLRA